MPSRILALVFLVVFLQTGVYTTAFAQIPELLDSAKAWQDSGKYQKICDIIIHPEELDSIPDDATWHALGDLYTSIGVALAQFSLRDSANGYYHKSISAYEKIAFPPHREIATSFNNLSFSNARLGLFQVAHQFIDSAQMYGRQLVGTDSLDVAGNTQFQLGVIYYFQEEFRQAMPFFKKSLQLRLNRDNPFDNKLSQTHNVIANSYIEIGEPDSSKPHFDRVLQILQDIHEPTHPKLATAYANQGFKYLALSEFELAKYYFLKSIQIHKKLFGEDFPNLHFAYGGLANVCLRIGADAEAYDHYQEKFRLATHESIYSRIQSHLNLAVCQYQVQRFDAGLETTISAENMMIANNIDSRSDLKKFLGLVKGLNASYCGQHNLAIASFEAVENATRIDLKDSLKFASSFAQILTRANKLQRALQILKEPYQKYCEAETSPNEVENLRTAISAEANLAEIYTALYDESKELEKLLRSISLLKKSIGRIDKLKHNLTVNGNRDLISQRYHSVYESLISNLILLYRIQASNDCLEEINFYIQKSHSQSLREAQKGREWTRHQFDGHDLLTNLHANNNSILKLEQSKFEFGQAKGTNIDLSYDDKMLNLVDENERLKKSIREHHPRLQDHFLETMPTLTEIQNNLGEHEIILNYFYGKDSLICMAIGKNEIEFTQSRMGDLDQKIDQFLMAIDLTQGEISRDSIAALGLHLYGRLVKPFESTLQCKTDIIVKPAGKLGYVPFAILLSESGQGIPFRSWPYLLTQFNFSLTTSMSDWISSRTSITHKAQNLYAGFAPSYEEVRASEKDDMVNSDFSELVRSGLMPLPRAVKEVTDIGALMDGAIFSGEEATKSSFQEIASKYQILHLAMHAITEDENPEYSKLIFSAGQDSTPTMLMSHELYGMDINSELVVLTACNTALGKLRNGEGINGLARAFSFAGAKSLVMSLWSIPDHTTSEVVGEFFTNLRKGQPKHIALKEAQLTFLENNRIPKFSHPFYWAGLIQAGNVAPIDFEPFRFHWDWILIATFLIGLGFLVHKVKTRWQSKL